jgi:hypothetical protein
MRRLALRTKQIEHRYRRPPASGPTGGMHEKPGAKAHDSGSTVRGNVATRPLFLPTFRGAPAARAIEPVQDVEVGSKKGVAPSKRSHGCFFGIVSPGPHGGQNNPLWLISSFQRSREARGRQSKGSVRRLTIARQIVLPAIASS